MRLSQASVVLRVSTTCGLPLSEEPHGNLNVLVDAAEQRPSQFHSMIRFVLRACSWIEGRGRCHSGGSRRGLVD